MERNKHGSNILKEEIAKTIKEEFQKLNKQDEYLSRKDVIKLLNISYVTLHDWTNKGILTSYKISGKTYYKRSEIESSLIKIEKK